ncbi:bifunctional adenosylcobinamide kinase/adenosylcobinamide-phosphate guanylyltransferase [Lentibacter sp. XHP0401]|uniref:bifunctional adenosylcobinamide kinase/adenosylcobinamide-phosphate guanylyltransferase n=1 Tax=Lentibacter sp. XHP0401 TaxID=2984334 RepID=UPI0021E8162F|nr:bifunctional adenosylcobinamide kinase/adenosylcobinamide-phosphate guanylyltransferase [Lentibacter sp. XHP0401]MCV2892061.1 bifunctional adenosylcobinamide kinase/adenosylcobinamide-phosphate guanylyltransferase [Lentibacter sp. XHP0401]
MEKSILITGGARSGKSGLAERYALAPTGKAIYIATAEVRDSEMAERIAAHKARRGPEWTDIHCPFDIADALHKTDGGDPRLVDCLTLWLTNHMLADNDWRTEADRLVTALQTQTTPVIFVTNEVGAGIVPENKLARDFRDAAGWLNQTIAQACDTVVFCVAGYPVKVKPNEHPYQPDLA